MFQCLYAIQKEKKKNVNHTYDEKFYWEQELTMKSFADSDNNQVNKRTFCYPFLFKHD